MIPLEKQAERQYEHPHNPPAPTLLIEGGGHQRQSACPYCELGIVRGHVQYLTYMAFQILRIEGAGTVRCPSGQTWAQNGRKTPVSEADLDGRGGRGQLIRRDLSGFIGLLT